MASDRPAVPESRVSRETAARAVDALLEWMRARAKQRKAQLLDHDDFLHLVLTLKKIPHRVRTNAHAIPLPHPIHSPALSVCLIADDRPTSRLPPAAARAVAHDLSLPVSNVIALSDLSADYRPFEARRKLCDSHDLFFADRPILPLLPRLLGKHFFKKKKIPVPLQLGRPSWPLHLRRCCGSGLLFLRTGTCTGVKVGRVSQDREEIIDNLLAAIEGAVDRVPKKWANVRSLHIKSVDSLALPIFQAMPEIGMKISLAVKGEEEKVIVKRDGFEEKQRERGTEKRRKNSGDFAKKVRYMDNNLEENGDDGAHEEGAIDELVGSEVRVMKKAKKDSTLEKKDSDDEDGDNAIELEKEKVIEKDLSHINNTMKKKAKKGAKAKELKKDQDIDGLKRKSTVKKLKRSRA